MGHTDEVSFLPYVTLTSDYVVVRHGIGFTTIFKVPKIIILFLLIMAATSCNIYIYVSIQEKKGHLGRNYFV